MRLFAQTEISQRRAGQDTTQWQGSLAGYLLQIAAAGQHPHLAAALADQPAGGDPAQDEPLFDRAMTRILTGLLPPTSSRQAGVQDRPDSAELVPVTTMPHVVEPPTPMAPL